MARVLIVDDEITLRTILRALLQRGGHEVDEAGSGTEALQRVAASPYDILLVDYQMPAPDGLEVLRQVRAQQPLCRRVLMSGDADVPEIQNALACADVMHILEKPFSRERLLEALGN